MNVVTFGDSMMQVEAAPDARTSCRVCGSRIAVDEPRIMWVSAIQYNYYSSRNETKRVGVHLQCWLESGGGRGFITALMASLSDEELTGMGFEVVGGLVEGAPCETIADQLREGDILRPKRLGPCRYGGQYVEGLEFRVIQYPHPARGPEGVRLLNLNSGGNWGCPLDELEFVRRP